MAWAQKLHNPTPWDRQIDWDRGIVIEIPAEGSKDLTPRQMEDFLPTQPGAEEIQGMLNTLGVFLEDTDRDYDSQARDCLTRCIKAKSQRYNEAVARMRANDTALNLAFDLESEGTQQKLENLGLGSLKREIDALERRLKIYTGVVGTASAPSKPKYDPKRTIFVMDPPREFKSETAMAIFLSENPDVADQHEAFVIRKTAIDAVEEQGLEPKPTVPAVETVDTPKKNRWI